MENRQAKYDKELIKQLYDENNFKSIIDSQSTLTTKEFYMFLYEHYKNKIPKYLIKNRIKLYQITGR